MTAFISYFNTENGRRSRYFEAFHGLLVFILLLYIFKYNFIYNVTEYNWILIPEWLLIWVVPAFIKKIHGVESFAARFALSFTCAFSIVHFLYLCGGLAAPGLIWLCAIPIVSAVLLGVYWAVLGNIFILGVLGIFLIFHEYGFGPNILAGADYTIEKFLNIALFVIFSGFMAISIFWGERNSVVKLEEKHGDIENLLRVLLHDVANTLSFMTMSLFLARRRQNGPEQWAGAIAARIGAPHAVLHKTRHGDRSVDIDAPDLSAWRDRTPVLVDDIASSGRTLIMAAHKLVEQGMRRPECVVVHALFAEDGCARRCTASSAP